MHSKLSPIQVSFLYLIYSEHTQIHQGCYYEGGGNKSPILCSALQFKLLVRGRGCTCQLMGSAHLGCVVKKLYYLFLSCLPFPPQTSPAGGENLGVILSLQGTRNFSVCLVALHLLMNMWECLSPFSLRNVVLSYTILGRSLWKALVVIPLCLYL